MSDNLPYYVGFSHYLGIGPVKFNKLLAVFGTVRAAYEAPRDVLVRIAGPITGQKFYEFRRGLDLEKLVSEIQQKDITIITREDSRYPAPLRDISDPPICLYIKGELNRIDFNTDICIGVVGTRRPTSYGAQVAAVFARDLAAAGCVIASGLALGIDAIAHKAALAVHGKTVAFLGCGVDIIYPPGNARIYADIIDHGGLVISEFPPGHTVLPGLFVARNRLISGVSKGVLVVEGLKDSGALITARDAAIQGKDVFAPPAPITSPYSEAPNLLLKEGAKLVISAQDILNECNLQLVEVAAPGVSLGPDEQPVYELIQSEPRRIDDLAQAMHMPVAALMGVVTTLEIKGVVERNREGKYQLKR